MYPFLCLVICVLYNILYNKLVIGTSLAVQWLRLLTSVAEGAGSIPGQETKILHAARCSQK